MKKIGVVGVPDGWSSERLADAVYEKTGYRLLIDMQKLALDLGSGQAWFEDTELTALDGLMIKKIGAEYSPDLLDRLEILRFLSERGLKIFSSPLSIMQVLDRLSCTITLKTAEIPMPQTTITEDPEAALRTVAKYGEVVFKPLFSTKAKGMLVIRDEAGARSVIENFRKDNPIMYIQRRVDLHGKDMGIAFLGGRYLTTYARVKSEGAWNTTTRSGGRYEAHDPPENIIALAQRAQDLFELDFTCVDVAETDEGPVVFEVSAFGGFRGILTARGIDAAALYADYVLERIPA
jgi:ribosomal protein S6--L-glutamate ligase